MGKIGVVIDASVQLELHIDYLLKLMADHRMTSRQVFSKLNSFNVATGHIVRCDAIAQVDQEYLVSLGEVGVTWPWLP